MSTWIPLACTGFFSVLSIAERFYARFCPNVNDQKRHLRIAAWIALHVLALSSLAWGFWGVASKSEPVTVKLVLYIGFLFFLLVLATINLLLQIALQFGKIFSNFLAIFEDHLKLTLAEAEVLDVFASKIDVSEDIKKKIRDIIEKIVAGIR